MVVRVEEVFFREGMFSLALPCLDVILALVGLFIYEAGSRFDPESHFVVRTIADQERTSIVEWFHFMVGYLARIALIRAASWVDQSFP